MPDFRYVATHIGDSIKRRLKADGATHGLLTATSTGADQCSCTMRMRKGDPGYEVGTRRVPFAERGTEIRLAPLLEGIRALRDEKIQWYLASSCATAYVNRACVSLCSTGSPHDGQKRPPRR